MAGKVRNLSTLIEQQLPEFISSEYPKFVKFLQKYYEQLENTGQPLDIILNLKQYQDIDTYENRLLSEKTTLITSAAADDTTIHVADTSSFPEKNGYFLIDDEVIFYTDKTDTAFLNCYRNISATTKLGDLYNSSTVRNVNYEDVGMGSEHYSNTEVYNISNLFLYAFIKNFEKQYLSSFPESNLKQSADKKTLIKNIKKFYQAKGTEQSIKFIFNSIVAEDSTDIPSVYYPKDSTIKSSGGEWVNTYSLKLKLLSGDPTQIIGQKIIQDADASDISVNKAFAYVDDVINIGNGYYQVVLADNSVVGQFNVCAKTFLKKLLVSSDSTGKRIYVDSTLGWNGTSGNLIIRDEKISYSAKTVNQFIIDARGQNPLNYAVDEPVYSGFTVYSEYLDNNSQIQRVEFIVFGVLYSLNASANQPYSSEGDVVESSSSGEVDKGVIVYDVFNDRPRWKYNQNNASPSAANSQPNLNQVLSDVSAIYEDDQYYYIASSGYPSHAFGKTSWNVSLKDQKFLKLIRKYPTRTTEIYPTNTKDVGVMINGVPLRSYRDEDFVVYGKIEKINVTSQGSGYQDPPYVLIIDSTGVSGVASGKAILSGDVVERIEVTDSGSGFFPPVPTIEIVSGRNAVVNAVVTSGKVTSLRIVNPGEYYSTAPRIVIEDALNRGRFASYESTITTDGKLSGFIKIDEGKFYTQENIIVRVVPVGSGATADSQVQTWHKNRYTKLRTNILDENNGGYFINNTESIGYGYAYIASPTDLRFELDDNIDPTGKENYTGVHSPILGYAYDGYPIYGPYGFSLPHVSTSPVYRMESSYLLKSSRIGGPPVVDYPLGTFIEDYEYIPDSGTLDENNGRYCVTPEYPNGTYAYFTSVDYQGNPSFPYSVGQNFYAIPVDASYNKSISQDDIPKNIKALRTPTTIENGEDIIAFVDSVKSGSISSITVESSVPSFSVNSIVDVNYENTGGSNILCKVDSVNGKNVVDFSTTPIFNSNQKCVKLVTSSDCYVYDNDVITTDKGVTGNVVGDIFGSKVVVLKNVSGTINKSDTISASIEVIELLVDKSSSYTAGSNISLTNGKQVIILSTSNNTVNVASNPFSNNDPIIFSKSFGGIQTNQIYYVINSTATTFKISNSVGGSALTFSNVTTPGAVAISEKANGIILETTDVNNTCRIRTLRGNFEIDQNYFLKSTALVDTIGSKIVQKTNLSKNIPVFDLNEQIAILTTDENHSLSVGDKINVDILPEYNSYRRIYVRKKIYQKVKLNTPSYTKSIKDTGVGRLITLNSGADYGYSSGGNTTITNVELIFADQSKCRDAEGRIVGSGSSSAVIGKTGNSNNAKATIIITNGIVTSLTITSKGSGYIKGDLLTFTNASGNRYPASISTAFYIAEVDHVGFSSSATKLYLNDVNSIAINDLLKIGKEVVKVNSISSNDSSVVVSRGQNNTTAVDHFNNQQVSSYLSTYNFSYGYALGSSSSDATVVSYDRETNELVLSFSLGNLLTTINKVTTQSFFYDQSTPRKPVTVFNVTESPSYKFEFSEVQNDNAVWVRNPIIEVQKYYGYVFDTSHTSLLGSTFNISPSINHNLVTSEAYNTSENWVGYRPLPGNAGSLLEVVFGYGDLSYWSNSGNYPFKKKNVDFSNYYYYDRNNIIDSDNSYFKIVEDPLQGEKTVIYKTPNSVVYELLNSPQFNPIVNQTIISYITSATSAIGKINSIKIINSGKDFTKLPIIYGIRPAPVNEATAEVVWDSSTKTIFAVNILQSGKNYSKPKAILINGDGKNASFDVIKNSDNTVASVVVTNKGQNYTYKPTIKIIESDVKVYFSSKTIGVPQKITVVDNGKGFNRDNTISKKFFIPQILTLTDIPPNAFLEGELIEQYDSQIKNGVVHNSLIARATVAKNGWIEGSNILKLQKVEGTFKANLPVVGKTLNNTATVNSVLPGVFNADVRSYYDNLGYYASDKSKIGSSSQKITDSYFYQDYSYVIRSKTPTSVWRDLIKKSLHPAGFNLFGEVVIESTGNVENPKIQRSPERVSVIQLWDPDKNKITVQNTYKTITNTHVKASMVDVERGRGSVFLNTFDDAETLAYEIYLTPEFNGYFDERGNRAGNTVFTMHLVGTGNVVYVPSAENLIITLDGILQEPEKAFTISGTEITFKEAPLGYRDLQGHSISSAQYDAGRDTPRQKFTGKILRFKEPTVNSNYFRKIQDISSQFNGTKTAFDLYDTLGNACQLGSKENLITTIDGILQEPGITPLIPANRSYYIRRSVVPNQIVFTEAPRVGQHFSSFSIANYERIEISDLLFDGQYYGPFVMKTALEKTNVQIFNENNLLVFVDGVLQRKNKSYTLTGSAITFTFPPKPKQKITIFYFYGRSTTSSVTAFNYEDGEYFNRIRISLSFIPSIVQYSDRGCYQGASYDNYTAIGTTKYVAVTGANTSDLIVESQNSLFDITKDIVIVNGSASGLGDYIIPSNKIVSVTPFETDDDTNQVLVRSNSGWLIGSSIQKKVQHSIDVGDKIKIDGEQNYREVLSIPEKVLKTQYNTNAFIRDNFYGKLQVTPSEEYLLGEGLSVYATIENGSVKSLLWNNKKYGTVGVSNLQSGGYNYENAPRLTFVPQPLRDEGGNIVAPTQGGGASGFVVLHNGDVVDIVLTSGGSNYLAAPKVLISRGFDIIKKPQRRVDTSVLINFSPRIESTVSISTVINFEFGFNVHREELLISRVSDIILDKQITVFFKEDEIKINDINVINPPIIKYIDFGSTTINSISSVSQQVTSTIATLADNVPITTISTVTEQITKFVTTGVIDTYEDTSVLPTPYSLGVAGANIAMFESGAFNDMGVANVGGISLQQFDILYPTVEIQEFDLRSASRKFINSDRLIDFGYGSTTEFGTYLQMDMNNIDTIIYVPNTNAFPSSGFLLIGKEIVSYTSKLSDRFLGVTRGQYATSHTAGDYIRTISNNY